MGRPRKNPVTENGVPVEVEDKDNKTLAVQMPTALHAALDECARAAGLTLSSWAKRELAPIANYQGDVGELTHRFANDEERKTATTAANNEKAKYMKLIKAAMQRGVNVEALLALENSIQVDPPA
jgi:hypothetical protein